MRADRLEQGFIKRVGAGYELLLVLESAAGRRERVTITAPPAVASNERAALGYLIRWLRSNGASLARLVRVRREVGGELSDAPELRELLLGAGLGDDEDGEDGWA